MNECLYVLLPCQVHHKRWLQEAAGADCEVVFRQDIEKAEADATLERATVVFGEPAPERLARMPKLRWLQMSWAGADRYTQSDCFPKEVMLSVASGAYGATIAEYIVGGILTMYRTFLQYERQRQGANWAEIPAMSLEGKTALILGAGDIGSETAKRLRPFGVQLVGIRRTGGSRPEFDALHTMDQLDTLLPQADVVICCLPNTKQTAGLLNEAHLRAMKQDALVVNVGRGSLIPLDQLTAVLKSGHLMGAVLDVFEQEPLPPQNELWSLPNVLLTPHVAGVGFGHAPQTEDKIIKLCCENLRRYLSGQQPGNLVDFTTGYRASI